MRDFEHTSKRLTYSTCQTSPTPLLRQALHYCYPQRNWKQMTPTPSSTREHPIWGCFGTLWPHFKLQQFVLGCLVNSPPAPIA